MLLKRYSFVLLSLVMVSGCDQPPETPTQMISEPSDVTSSTVSEETIPEAKPATPSKLDAMQARFDTLKEARKLTKLQVSRLSSRLSRSEFPPEQAKAISQQMRRANYMLKNPRLLGAFSSVDEIETEITSLQHVNVKLDEIKKLLDEKREKENG